MALASLGLARNEDPRKGDENSEAYANPQSACCSDFAYQCPATETTKEQCEGSESFMVARYNLLMQFEQARV